MVVPVKLFEYGWDTLLKVEDKRHALENKYYGLTVFKQTQAQGYFNLMHQEHTALLLPWKQWPDLRYTIVLEFRLFFFFSQIEYKSIKNKQLHN